MIAAVVGKASVRLPCTIPSGVECSETVETAATGTVADTTKDAAVVTCREDGT